MRSPSRRLVACLALTALALSPLVPRLAAAEPLPVTGRWDVTVDTPEGPRPCGLEFTESPAGLALSFQGFFGAPQRVPFVAWDGERLEFQLEDGERWTAVLRGRWLDGSKRRPGFRVPDGIPADPFRRFFGDRGGPQHWTAVRAPALPPRDVRWGAAIALCDGRTLRGWRPRHAGSAHGWTVRDGALANVRPGDDLVTRESWDDFRLSLQFRLPPGSDSGVHLRGRYEVQLTDRPENIGAIGGTGSIYGRLTPVTTVTCAPGEWHTLDVTLVGRQVTLALDGTLLLDRATIAGITGDALDSHEGRPGPLMLQGYMGEVEFRNLTLTPALR